MFLYFYANRTFMPSCTRCGAYTKYQNGLCYSCWSGKKSTAGKVYVGEVTFPNGRKKLYTGQTRRSVYKRVGEHITNVKNGNSRHYTGRGTFFNILGSIFSNNRYKAERTIKKYSPAQKRRIAKYGARKFKSKNLFDELNSKI
jgi:hypothetical protein